MRVVKVLEHLAVLLPKELCAALGIREGSELDVWQIGPSALGLAKRKELKFSPEETALLHKLLAIKFEERTPQRAERELVKGEKELLVELMRKGAVTLHFSEKYPKGVYNIVDSAYHSLIRARPGERPKEERKEEEGELEKGYIIIESETEARRVSDTFAERIKKGEIAGVRGFDKKFYIVTSLFLSRYRDKIKDTLKGQRLSAAEVAKEIGIELQAAAAVLAVMNSEGEIVEKRKGIFTLS